MLSKETACLSIKYPSYLRVDNRKPQEVILTKDYLDKEYQFYINNKTDLQAEYNNKYIALQDCKVVKSGNTKKEVIDAMLEEDYKLGEFLVHLVSSESDIVQRYYSRVS